MRLLGGLLSARLNAPFGARCFLTGRGLGDTRRPVLPGLNAPFGARCFLTQVWAEAVHIWKECLNAPFGARCFLTGASVTLEKSGGSLS